MIFHSLEEKYISYISDPNKKIDAGSQMTAKELAFLLSILDEVKPKKVLEVGVAKGGTTCAILDILKKQGQNAFLYSVDLNENYYEDKNLLTGYKVKENFPELMGNWELLTGKILPERIDAIGGDIDLVVLDTVHLLPGEILDLPVFLPFLKDGAWVIIHDTNLFTRDFRREAIATKVVFDTVVAEKRLYYEKSKDGQKRLSNIGAFRVGPDTRKYIVNCFTAMAMPWTYVPPIEQRNIYKDFYQKHYNEELVELFELAYEQNCQGVKNRKGEKIRFIIQTLKIRTRGVRRKLLFYKFFKSLRGKK